MRSEKVDSPYLLNNSNINLMYTNSQLVYSLCSTGTDRLYDVFHATLVLGVGEGKMYASLGEGMRA